MSRSEQNKPRDGEKKKRVTRSSLKKALRILAYMKPFSGAFIAGLLFLFITGGTALIFPKLMGNMIDAARETTIDDINKTALLLLVVFIVQAIASFFRIYLARVDVPHRAGWERRLNDGVPARRLALRRRRQRRPRRRAHAFLKTKPLTSIFSLPLLSRYIPCS